MDNETGPTTKRQRAQSRRKSRKSIAAFHRDSQDGNLDFSFGLSIKLFNQGFNSVRRVLVC